MLTQALEVVGSVGRNVVETAALALWSLAGCPLAFGVEVLVVLEFVVAEALGLRTYHLALTSSPVAPRKVQSVLAFLRHAQLHGEADVQLLQFVH